MGPVERSAPFPLYRHNVSIPVVEAVLLPPPCRHPTAGYDAHGGVGNGVFETVQDFLPLTEIAFLQLDDMDGWNLLVITVGDHSDRIWERFLAEYADTCAICRFGDDLGFQSSTLIQPTEIIGKIIPQYQHIIRCVHEAGKSFLLLCCGAIRPVMDSLIEAGIDTKHSNEDNISPFSRWTGEYGESIGNLSGVDMNILCSEDERGVGTYVRELKASVSKSHGAAWGSGNQITDYTPPENFLAMARAFRAIF